MDKRCNPPACAAALFLAAVGLAAAPFPATRPEKDDLGALQGRWRLVAEVFWGDRQAPEDFEAEICANKLVYYRDGKKWGVWRISLDAKGGPGAIDLRDWNEPEEITVLDRDEKDFLHPLRLKRIALKPIRGRYRLEGDRLMICTGPYWGDRPSGFTASGDNEHLRVYRREHSPAEEGGEHSR